MNLIFNEYINFLNEKGLEKETKIKLQEGYYWYDNSIIKAYDKEGNIHKIVRINVDDKLNVNFKTYPQKTNLSDIESWKQTVIRNKDKLLELEQQSCELINNTITDYKGYQIGIPYSGGKDSEVVKYLVDKCTSNYRVLFNNTTCDVKETYEFIKQVPNIEIITPSEGIYQWRKRNNFVQTRFSRSCCSIFKEKALVDYLDKDSNILLFLGMRNEESNTRKGYTDFWNNDIWSKKWQGVLPIRKWSEEDIWLYILLKDINFNAKYKYGYRRCGCSILCLILQKQLGY